MPFTPIHMGPGILIKAVCQTSFSLMIFGWTQIVMDIQPLLVLITGEGHLHGFTHTYLGAILITLIAVITGKPLAEWALRIGIKYSSFPFFQALRISWLVALFSAAIGSASHVYLDSIMHSDVQPYFPWQLDNPFWQLISISQLHKLCLYMGLVGSGLYLIVRLCIAKPSSSD